MYRQIHQEQIVAGMTTQHKVENPAVQEQVIVQEIPLTPQVQIVERIQEQIVEPIDVQAPAVTSAAPSQQLPSIIEAVTNDVKFDITGLVNPQISITFVEAYVPQVVGSLPPLQEFVAPVYNQIHQEHIVTGMTTQHRVGNPAVQEQVIVQEIPQIPIVEQIPEQIVDSTGLVIPQFSITGVEVSAPQAVGSFPSFGRV